MTLTIGKALFGATAALCLMGAATAATAHAGLSVSPVTVEFTDAGRTQALQVANPGDEPVHIQVRLFDWTTDRDGDHYAPSRDIGFSPPMFELQAGATQIVRLATRTTSSGRERAYRLFVDQLLGEAEPGQLKMPVRMILPVFVEGGGDTGLRRAAANVAATLQWRLEFDERSGRATLIAANFGSRRVKLTNLAYERDGVRRPIREGLAGYVLAGQERGWDFPLKGRLGALEVSAVSEGGLVQAHVAFTAH